MHIAQLTNVALHWREDGDPSGRPVVFCNSLGTDLRLWDKVVARLPAGLRLIRFDNRGHGLSSCPEGNYAMDDLVADTAELLDHLGVRDCLFVGLSIGGMVAQKLAATRPDLVAAAVLADTAARMGTAELWETRIEAISTNGLASMADGVMERWFPPAFRATPECLAWRHMLVRTPEQGYLGCCHALANADLTASTAKLRLPVLGICGSEDGASPPDLVKGTIDLIPGARFVEIADTGHLPCVDGADAFAQHLTAFLAETAL